MHFATGVTAKKQRLFDYNQAVVGLNPALMPVQSWVY
jgi:hypothetical protein